MEPICPQCHVPVRPTDYFCANCGKSLHAKPLSTSLTTEIMYYIGSLLLPPLGYWWGFKYLKQPDAVSKRIGIIIMVLTTISFILTSLWAVEYINKLNATLGGQLNGTQGF